MREPAGEALVLSGIPDDGRIRTKLDETGAVQFIWPGTAAFADRLGQVFSRVRELVLPLPPDIRLDVPALPTFNHMADPDRYSLALRHAAVVVETLRTPCFNHPAAVLRTTRDMVSQTLAGIDGLVVPRVLRVTPRSPRDVAAAVASAGLDYPVIVRLTGTQTQQTMIRVDGPGDWDMLFTIPWGGASLYVTQFVDYANEAGWFEKARLFFVGDQIFAVHRQKGLLWAMSGRAINPAFDGEETAWLEAFEEEALPRVAPVLSEIRRRIGLDLFGLDCAFCPDGSLLLFEATACMNWFRPGLRVPPLPATERVRCVTLAALLDLASRPEAWRHKPSATVAAA